ncbi:TPA: hypothetical protein KE432_002192 [Corynebacterium striatum]|nr:hypothetical protein [Corynebacterium striatum]
MDLSTIQMHLDNFVDTWKGWGLVFKGLDAWFGNGGIKGAYQGLDDAFYNFSNGAGNLSSALSSK